MPRKSRSRHKKIDLKVYKMIRKISTAKLQLLIIKKGDGENDEKKMANGDVGNDF